MGAIGAIGVFGGSAFAMTLMACYGGPCASEGPDGCGRPYDAGGEADAKDDAKEVAPDSAVDSGSGDDTSIDSTPTDAPSDAAAEAAEGG